MHQLVELIRREQSSRTLFSASSTPDYERIAAFASPPIAFLGALIGGWLLVRRGKLGAPLKTLLVLAAIYFGSLPLLYTAGGNEGARRTWAFSYIAVALLLAVTTDALLSLRRRTVAATAVLALVAAITVGNVAAGLNQYYRFPGPVSTRSEIRVVTPELRAAADWLERTQGAGRKLVIDQYSGPSFAYFGHAFPNTPSARFPTWKLYLSPRLPRPVLVRDLETSRFVYLVANAAIPLVPSFYHTGNPSNSPGIAPGARRGPTTRVVIDRYDRLAWAIKLYGTGQFAIYRLDFRTLRSELARLH
jgi:hypothetical protein